MKRIICILALAVSAAAVRAQTPQYQPETIGIAGTDTPLTTCTALNYGQGFQRTDVSPNKWGTCGADGWVYRGVVGWPASAGIPNYGGSSAWGTSYDSTNKIPFSFLNGVASAPVNGVNVTADFTMASSTIYKVACASPCTATIPASIVTGFSAALVNVGPSAVTIASGGPAYDGATSLPASNNVTVFTDGTGYHSSNVITGGGSSLPHTANLFKGDGSGGALAATPSTDYTVPSDLTPLAPKASPALTGTPTTPTASPGTGTTQIASQAYADASSAAVGALKLNVANPGFTGVETGPTLGQNVPGSTSNIIGSIQKINSFALRSIRTKTGIMELNRAGYSGYSTPAQLYVIGAGDSTTGFHASTLMCSLGARYGVAGYILAGYTGVAALLGQNCPTMGTATSTYAGGASAIGNDFAHFPSGGGSDIPAGGSVTTNSSFYSTRQLAFYTADSGGASITVSTSPDNVTFTPLSSCNGVAVTASVGAVCDQTIAVGFYYLRVSASGGDVKLWTVGQVNTGANGVVPINVGVGGTSLPDDASTPTALTQPWWNAIHPDVMTVEFKNNGGNTIGPYPACLQATTAVPGTGQPRSFWWGLLTAPILAANPYADIITYGSYDISDQCIGVYNQYEQQWSASQTYPQTYVDNYYQVNNAAMQALGWIDTSVHELGLGQAAHSALDNEYLGIANWPGSWESRNLANNATVSNVFWMAPVFGPHTQTVGLQSSYPVNPIPYQPTLKWYSKGNANGQILMDFTNVMSFNNFDESTTYLCLGSSSVNCTNASPLVAIGGGVMQLRQVDLAAQQTATLSQVTAKSTLASPSGHGYVQSDKGATSARSVYRSLDAGSAKWEAGMSSDDNWDIVDLTLNRLNFAVTLGSSPYLAALINSTGVHTGVGLDTVGGNINNVLLLSPSTSTPTTATTGGTIAASTSVCYRVSSTNAIGETLASVEKCVTTGSGTATNTATQSWTKTQGATGYKVYGRTTGAELLMSTIASVDTTSFTDTGSITPSGALPGANTAGGSYQMQGNTVIPAATTGVHGNGVKIQYSDNTGTNGNVPKFDANGNVVDGGIAVTALPTNLLACGSTTTCANTVQTSPRMEQGRVTLAAGTATVTGMTAWTSTTSFGCTATDETGATLARAVPASTSSITVTGTGTDVIFYQCAGN